MNIIKIAVIRNSLKKHPRLDIYPKLIEKSKK